MKAPVVVVGGVEVARITWPEYYKHRERQQEALLINKGLFALKRVIQALNDKCLSGDPGIFVPYPDSKLTQVLESSLGRATRSLFTTVVDAIIFFLFPLHPRRGEERTGRKIILYPFSHPFLGGSLSVHIPETAKDISSPAPCCPPPGGDSRTVLLACCARDHYNAVETVNTLRFAEACSHVAIAGQQKDETAAVKKALGVLDGEIAELEAQIRAKEVWATEKVVRKDLDTVAGEFGEFEVDGGGGISGGGKVVVKEEFVDKVVLKGAETERARLEECLEKKADLMKLQGMGRSVLHDLGAGRVVVWVRGVFRGRVLVVYTASKNTASKRG